jgi:hypothetical protein
MTDTDKNFGRQKSPIVHVTPQVSKLSFSNLKTLDETEKN